MTRPDSEILRDVLREGYLTTEQREVIERVIPRLQLEEEELARTRRADDDTAPIGSGARAVRR